jgi:hypothetical protein
VRVNLLLFAVCWNLQIYLTRERRIKHNKHFLRIDFFFARHDAKKRNIKINIRDVILKRISARCENKQTTKKSKTLTGDHMTSQLLAVERLQSIGYTDLGLDTNEDDVQLARRVMAYRVYDTALRKMISNGVVSIEPLQSAEQQEEYASTLSPDEMWRATLMPWLDSDVTLPRVLRDKFPVSGEERHICDEILVYEKQFLLRKGWPFLVFDIAPHRQTIEDVDVQFIRRGLNIHFIIGDGVMTMKTVPPLPRSFQLCTEPGVGSYAGCPRPFIVDEVNHHGPYSLHPSYYMEKERQLMRHAQRHARLKASCGVISQRRVSEQDSKVELTVRGPNGSEFVTWPLHDPKVLYNDHVPLLVIDNDCCYLVARDVARTLGIADCQTYEATVGSSAELERSLSLIKSGKLSDEVFQIPLAVFSAVDNPVIWSVDAVRRCYRRTRDHLYLTGYSNYAENTHFHAQMSVRGDKEVAYEMGTNCESPDFIAETLAMNTIFPVFVACQALCFNALGTVENTGDVFDVVADIPVNILDVFAWATNKPRNGSSLSWQLYRAAAKSNQLLSELFARGAEFPITNAYVSAMMLLMFNTDATSRTHDFMSLKMKQFNRNLDTILRSHEHFIWTHGFCETCNKFITTNQHRVRCTSHVITRSVV